MLPNVSDETLVKRALAGSDGAWTKLVRRYERRIYNYALRMVGHQDDAYDLMQEVFLGVYRNLSGYRGDGVFAAWLFASPRSAVPTTCVGDGISVSSTKPRPIPATTLRRPTPPWRRTRTTASRARYRPCPSNNDTSLNLSFSSNSPSKTSANTWGFRRIPRRHAFTAR